MYSIIFWFGLKADFYIIVSDARPVSVSQNVLSSYRDNHMEPGGGGYSHILAIWVNFKPFGLVWGLVIIENWSIIGPRLTGSLTKDGNQEQLNIVSLV